MRLANKVAVVTGAGRGVGKSIAVAFASEGAKVVVTANNESEITTVAGQIRDGGGEAIAVYADVGRTADCERLAEMACDTFGTIDVLVNNAAIITPGGLTWEVDPDEWVRTLDVNVGGFVRCARAVLPTLIAKRDGRIINVASGAGINTMPYWTAYSVSKAAIIHLTKNLADELMRYGVNVNAVGVHAVTQLWRDQIATGSAGGPHPQHLQQMIERGRVPLTEENTATFVWLASDDSRHVTGSYLNANGLPAAWIDRT